MRKIIIVLILTTILFSCGGAGDTYKKDIVKTQTFDNSKEEIWNYVISIFGDLNFPIKTLEKDSWIIQSDIVSISEDDIFTFTTTEGGKYKGGTMSFTIYLKDNNQKTDVTISSDFMGNWYSTHTVVTQRESNSGFHRLYSNGKYEKIIFDKIKEKLK